ncbi:MAG: hypothetical protein QOF33_2689 [Thermomicrobiales bacterium]|nr:hypothetical protein [Thermomicrobiales bacterium]MEA2524964.1 hypothetical protein [Thermomicrobiales bacterium]MEA2584604.1 hypothetical protein [Thermomicrobiales bacterium]MEA2598376.1 hypothetical protein [Thermomicrobiales bacterium]
MADDLRKLLDHIVRSYVLHDELVGIDLDASASDRGEDIETDKRRAVRREVERADSLAGAFSRALARARAGSGELVLDDRNLEENQEADALIGFLVSHDLASSSTEETEAMHYRYHVAVDWDRLGEVARAAGIDLDQALQRTSG